METNTQPPLRACRNCTHGKVSDRKGCPHSKRLGDETLIVVCRYPVPVAFHHTVNQITTGPSPLGNWYNRDYDVQVAERCKMYQPKMP